MLRFMDKYRAVLKENRKLEKKTKKKDCSYFLNDKYFVKRAKMLIKLKFRARIIKKYDTPTPAAACVSDVYHKMLHY